MNIEELLPASVAEKAGNAAVEEAPEQGPDGHAPAVPECKDIRCHEPADAETMGEMITDLTRVADYLRAQQFGVESQTPRYVEDCLKSANANTQCRDEIIAIIHERQKQDSKMLEQMWRNGKRVERLRTEKEYRRPTSGDESVRPMALCSELSGLSIPMLNKMARLYKAFRKDQEKADLLECRNEMGRPLTWHHLEHLLPLFRNENSRATFEEWLQKTLDNNWSPETLRREIRQHKQGKTAHAGGQPPNLTGQVARLTNLIRKNAGEISDNSQVNFLESLKVLPKSDLLAVQEFCNRQIAGMRALDKYIDSCIAAQADQDGRDQDAQIEKVDAGTPAGADTPSASNRPAEETPE